MRKRRLVGLTIVLFSLAGRFLSPGVFVPPSKTVTLEWDYPDWDTNIVFNVYHSQSLSEPVYNWPLLMTVATNSCDVPGDDEYCFFTVTASNQLTGLESSRGPFPEGTSPDQPVTDPATNPPAGDPTITNSPSGTPAIPDPTSTNTTATDPTVTDPTSTNSTVVDPTVTDPTATNTAVVDPTMVDPTPTNATVADSPVTDPTVTDPTVADPTVTDPTTVAPAWCPIRA